MKLSYIDPFKPIKPSPPKNYFYLGLKKILCLGLDHKLGFWLLAIGVIKILLSIKISITDTIWFILIKE